MNNICILFLNNMFSDQEEAEEVAGEIIEKYGCMYILLIVWLFKYTI